MPGHLFWIFHFALLWSQKFIGDAFINWLKIQQRLSMYISVVFKSPGVFHRYQSEGIQHCEIAGGVKV